jgi:hypothetical protein
VPEQSTRSPYAGYDVLEKWQSASFDDTTRRVLELRLSAPPEPRFFAPDEFRSLEAACARLLATERGYPPIAHWIDADLYARRGEGFRHPDMPSLEVAWRAGVRGLDAEARRRHGGAFADLEGSDQDDVLRRLQAGDVETASFAGVAAERFFTHMLLKAAAGHYYSQPRAWSEIGFGGPASPRGYVRIGLDQRDPWEAPLSSRREAPA